MIKLIKFLKPFTLSILLAIALLYMQAMADLELPDYMSNIVNNGIQNNGFDKSAPEIMLKSDFDRLQMMLSEDEKDVVNQSYVPKDSDEYDALYTKVKDQEIVVLKQDDDALLTETEKIMSRALITVAALPGIDLENMDDFMLLQMGAQASSKYVETLGADLETIQRNYILMAGLKMLGVAFIGAVASILVGLIAARVAAGLGKNLRKAIFTKVQGFSNAEFDQFSTASLITRSTNDINQIQTLMVLMVRMLFYAPILGFGGVLKAIEKSSSMSWIIALAVVILMGIISLVFAIAYPKFKIVQKMIDRLNLVVRENLTGMMVVRAFNTQAFEEKRFDQANKDLTQINLFVNRVMTFLIPIMMVIMNGVTLLIVWVGAHQIADSQMQVGDMMAFMQYAIQIIMSFLFLSMMFIMIPRATVSANRIAEVLESKESIHDPENPVMPAVSGKGEVEFTGVHFKYPGAEEEMIKGISFKAKAGEFTAIIGSTGSGKTTLMNLLPRFYDVTEGKILIDGIDIKQMKQKELRSLIGYVPQKASLFSGSISSNLLVGDAKASSDVIERAIDIAQAREIIDEKPEGLEAPISQSGANVSGGQKQRLSIARALVKQPKIYIFDDSFSALDYKTDSKLRQALREKAAGATILVVAQRIATIKNADQILVMDEGRLVGKGTHQELMATCTTYQEIAYSQLSKEELS